jgi:uncharacterized damage-inducible protein DinB
LGFRFIRLLPDQPHRPLPHLGRKPVCFAHTCILSRNQFSGKSGAVQSIYDKNLLEFSEQLDEKDVTYPKTKRTMRNGRTFLLSISDLMTQYMVHTAHHRGQLSQILDELGIEHDIGSTFAFAEEVKE